MIKILKFVLLIFTVLFNQAAFSDLDAKKLRNLKASSAYIVVESGESKQSGSGFLIHKDKQTGIVVTNAHVVDLNLDYQKIGVVFNSGTQKEKILPAKIIAINHADDLAFLKVSSKKLPSVIPLNTETEVIETQELYMIGFPFGEQFATNRENPIVTISRGIISSKRLDINDQVLLLQIDGDINPGNSGGPIVNNDGELVGVSVATVKKTNIGFAIPKSKVTRMLEGSLGNIRLVGKGKKSKIVTDLLDPFQLVKGATLFISRFEGDDTSIFLNDKGEWEPINKPILKSKFNLKKDIFTAKISKLPVSKKKYLAQIRINHVNGIRYQAPFRIEKRKLSISLLGPQVWQNAASVLAKTEENRKTDQSLNDNALVDELVLSILIDSGIDAYIKNMAKEPEAFFEEVNKEEENSEKKEFVLKFVEILRKDWDHDEIVNHYVRSLKANLSVSQLRKINSLFELPEFRDVHISINELSTIDFNKLKKFIKKSKQGKRIEEDKRLLVKEIQKVRRLSKSVLVSFEVTNRSVLNAMNDVSPKNRRKAEKYIEQDLKNVMGPYRRAWDNISYYYMLQNYQKTELEDLQDYLHLAQKDAFQAFIKQEYQILSTFLNKHMLSVEDEVKKLMSELQQAQLGIEKLPSLSHLSDDKIIQLLFDTYGKSNVIDALLKKTFGEISVSNHGSTSLYSGKPRRDYISTRTILMDLKRIKMRAKQFAEYIQNQDVEKRYSEINQKKWQNARPYSK